MIIMRARGVLVCFLKGLLRGFFVCVYILKHISFLHLVDTMNDFGYHEWFHFQRSKWQHMRIVFPLSLSTSKISGSCQCLTDEKEHSEMWKIFKLNKIWRPGSRSCHALSPQQSSTTKQISLCSWQELSQGKVKDSVHNNPPNFLFFSIRALLPLPCMWITIVADSNCNSLLIPNKPNIAEEISGSLFTSGQQRRWHV